MDIGDLPELASGFVSLLLLPTLGVVGLLHRRALPLLGWTLVAWLVLGALGAWTGHTGPWSRERFLHGWLLGAGLGAAFLGIALLNQDRRVKPWIRFGLALLTVAVFARSLLEFVRRFAS
jgi:hypothetical protein